MLVEATFTGEDLVEVTTVEGGGTEEGEYLSIDYGSEWLHEVEYEGVCAFFVCMQVAAGGGIFGCYDATYDGTGFAQSDLLSEA